MKPLLFIAMFYPLFAIAQDTGSPGYAQAGPNYSSIDTICTNTESIKYFLRKIVSDKDNFKEIYRQIINDPAMKNVVKELKDIFREDRGMLDKKNNQDFSRNKNEITFNCGMLVLPEGFY